MRHNRSHRVNVRVAALLACAVGLGAAADRADAGYLDLMGIPELEALLGAATPDGTGIKVQQIEALSGSNYMPIPDQNPAYFSGKTISAMSGASPSNSAHASLVARNFYSNTFALASGITEADVFEATDWTGSGFLGSSISQTPQTTDARIANHSWISSDFSVLDELQRFDYLVDEDDLIQVAGMSNTGPGTFNSAIWGSSYNAITVGLTNGNHYNGSGNVGGIYNGLREAPTLVTPGYATNNTTTFTSYAAPMVSSVSAMLLEVGQDVLLSNGSYTNRTRTINHAEASEVIKAVLMAGADRYAVGPRADSDDDLLDYAVNTPNNLDNRYGAGQMNVLNAYLTYTAGEQDSIQDGGGATVDAIGWDYDPSFGGSSGSNATATYTFSTMNFVDSRLYASLVWNLDVEDSHGGSFFVPTTTLHDLNLDLKLGASTVESSNSTVDNTENLYEVLAPGEQYDLVVSKVGGNFDFDYAIAWRVEYNRWGTDADGNWSQRSNWTEFTPDGSDNAAAFHGDITAPRTVTLDQNATLRGIWFDAASSYTLATDLGTETVTLNDSASSQATILVTDDNGSADHDVQAELVLVDDLLIDTQTSAELGTTGGIDNAAGRAITKNGTGDWRIDGTQSHGSGASLTINDGGVIFDSDAGGGGANLAVTVDGGDALFNADQSLASLDVVAGSIQIGNSPGQITTGSYSQAAGVVLEIEIEGAGAGVGYDQIAVTGAANIDGTLDLQLDGYSPSIGEQFIAIDAATLTGQFDTVTGVLHNNLSLGLAVTYSADDVIVTAAFAGDSNLDLIVDELDLALLAANWNQTGKTWAGGDFTGEGTVDAIDLYVLSRNWGAAVPLNEAIESAFAGIAIPEPATGLIGLIGLTLMMRRRRRTA